MKTTQRYLALDVLRGMTVAMMILVNNPGSWAHIYAPLEHSKWHGCTPTDLVFPFFLFAVGVSMFFSFRKYGNTLNKESFIRVARRTVLIFAVGLFLATFPQWLINYSNLRILGVLPRIALAYGIGSVIVLAFRQKYLPYIGGAILLFYWGLLYFLGESDPYSLQGNATIPVDIAVLGVNHMYKGFGIPFDPEGLLSTIPAVVTVIFGYLIGGLVQKAEKSSVPTKLLVTGATGIALGLLWGIFFPINKPLWTSSYVLYTAGWACLVLALLIWIIDRKGYTRWTSFFLVFGMNPLFIFALAGLWARITGLIRITLADGTVQSGSGWLYSQVFQPLAGDTNGSLLFAIAHVLLFWLVGYVLYKKKIFIKV